MRTYATTSSYLLPVMLVVGTGLLAAGIGLYPIVFADEYTYSKFARLLSFDQANIPSYLYFLVYGMTDACGEGFLACARLLNVVFFVSAVPFIYMIARTVADERAAFAVAVLSLVGPVSSYTLYFMPESMYFALFWVATYFLLFLTTQSRTHFWGFAGVCFGLVSLVKPHALFLLPAIGIYFLFSDLRTSANKIESCKKYSVFFLVVVLTKFSIGFLLAGESGLTFFGQGYTSYASASMADPEKYWNILRLAAENIKGHLLSVTLLFSVAVAQTILMSKYLLLSNHELQRQEKVALYTFCILVVLLVVVSVFTASVSGTGPYESNARLHMRYYNFAFPLFLIVVASQASLKGKSRILDRVTVALLVGLAVIYALTTGLDPYVTSVIDNPELRGFTFKSSAFHALGVVSLLALVLWVYDARAGTKFFLFVFMPLAVGFSTFYINHEVRKRLTPDVYDKAGIFAKQYLTEAQISKTVVAGSHPAALFRTTFYLDNANASLETLSAGAPFELSRLTPGKEWVLVVGEHALPREAVFTLPMNGFTLARISAPNTIDFKEALWQGVISDVSGLSTPETWGTWSSGDTVVLEFPRALPDRFRVRITAHAFGPNVGREFICRVGNRSVAFKLAASSQEVELELDNPSLDRRLFIVVPLPTSPKDLGISGDERKLGIGLTELRIEPV